MAGQQTVTYRGPKGKTLDIHAVGAYEAADGQVFPLDKPVEGLTKEQLDALNADKDHTFETGKGE